MKYYIYFVITIVTAAIIAGFVVVGSPENKRVLRFDERRISDLSNIQWQIINYWQRKNKLPDNLEILNDDISGFMVPIDPKAGNPSYEYEHLNDLSFRLCATFEAEFPGGNETDGMYSKYQDAELIPRDAENQNWSHGIGRTCFERTIDPDLYKPLLQ